MRFYNLPQYLYVTAPPNSLVDNLASTGVIGSFLPMDKIAQGISAAAVKLGRSETSLIAAARGMLTTDTIHKLAGRTITVNGREIQVTGMAKGAAMMGPNMATMLALVMTNTVLAYTAKLPSG